MCGINGILSFSSNNTVDLADVIKCMNNAVQHRGPDDEGVFIQSPVALGHRRLSIIDLSPRGHQPMASPDRRYIIVYNGEVYNYAELKKELKDYPFISDTDTEVVLAAYLKWGESCLNKFNGMFAFAVYDTVEKSIFIARDRLGIKPLYYYQSDSCFVFSSELRGVLASKQVAQKINRNVLTDYVQYQTVFAPQTIIKQVKMLLPGHFMEVKNSTVRIKKYWDYPSKKNAENQNNNPADIYRNIRELLISSVERRLISDVPFGAFLSGGIDSSLITAIIRKDLGKTIDTFSINFKEKEYSEEYYSTLIARQYQTRHHPILLEATDFLHDLPAALQAIDHPGGDGPNTYTVSKVTKQAGITMALSGLGGDELFGGYSIFKQSMDIEKMSYLNAIPLFIRKMVGEILYTVRKRPATQKIKNLLALPRIDYQSIYPEFRKTLPNEEIEKITGTYHSYLQYIISDCFKKDIPVLSKISLAEIHTYMQNVLLRDSDQMSMAHALEIRVPFLDHQLVEYVLSIDDSIKYPSSPKQLLIRAFEGYLPHELIYRKKMGFVFPWEKWLKNELKDEMSAHIIDLENRELFTPGSIVNLWNRFQNNDPLITWTRVWPLIVLENWMKKNNVEA